MSKQMGVFVLLVFLTPRVFCDSDILQTYKQNFSKDGLPAKAGIIEKAASDEMLEEHIGEFYEYVLDFALDNSGLLKDDPDMLKLVSTTVHALRDTGGFENFDMLWKLFLEYADSAVGESILITLGKLGKGNQIVIDDINDYLTEQNSLFVSGVSVNYAMISACIAAILELGDSSSYPALFTILCAGYPEVIAFDAQGALELIHGDLKNFLYNEIEKSPPDIKFIALKTGINSERLSLSERGQLAELALEQSLLVYGEDNNLSAMRYAAVLALTQLRWTRANALAIRHYYRVQTDYQHNAAGKERFVEAIECLGAVGNSDAALALVLQLGLINARAERTNAFDVEITLAIVQALGLIGDKAAFDQLLYVSNLSYPENIKAAAKAAIDRLKW